MFHVFYRGGYKTPHEFNCVVGVVLLPVTLFLSYTRYLFPWYVNDTTCGCPENCLQLVPRRKAQTI